MSGSPTAVSPALLEGLGIVVTRWAYVEALEGEFLSYLTGAKDGNLYVITQAVSGKSITSWLRTLADLKFTHEESRKKIADLFNRIDEVRAERNALVHGLWRPDPGDKSIAIVQTVNLARSAMIKDELVTSADLTDLIERIGDIMRELILVGTNLGWHKSSASIRLV
jgi:hypothetical protein